MKNNLTTPAGQTNSTPQHEEHANAINQVFGLFRYNYHNQYYKALPDDNALKVARRLWLDSLKRFSPDTILAAGKSVIQSSEFMPTLRTMIRHCESQIHSDMPDAHAAYIEACRAPSPKYEQTWSHLAVYYAGKQCDWHFLQSSSEDVAYPVFKKTYEHVCQQIREGMQLPSPKQAALPETPQSPILDKTENLERLKSLKNVLGEL